MPLPEEVGDRLLDLQAGLENVNWTPFDNFHLTLACLGEVDGPLLGDVDAMLAGVEAAPFELVLQGAGQFIGASRGGVWVGVEPSPALVHLKEKVATACRRAGARLEARKFIPHVTVGYLRRAGEEAIAGWRAAHNLFRSAPFEIDEFHLYALHKTKSGNVYEILAAYPLSLSR